MLVTWILVGLVLLLLSYRIAKWKGHDHWMNVGTRDLGLAVLIPSVTFIVIDRHREEAATELLQAFDEHGREVIAAVASKTLPNQLKTLVGENVASEVISQTIDPPFQYSEYEISGELKVDRDSNPNRVICRMGAEFVVTNRNHQEQEWILADYLSSVRPGATIALHRIRVTKMNGVRPGEETLLDLTDGDLVKRYKKIAASEYSFEEKLQLAPKTSYHVLIEKTVGEDVHGDFYQRTRYPCHGMSLSVSFNPQELQLTGGFLYPRGRATENVLKEIVNGRAKLELFSVALPQQGLYIEWTPKE